ncbi:MAG: hypothetical protein K2K16_10880 [Ruminococcus sp.]|nr:hypothetical protein [Ruminococcus sp.]
MKLTEKMSYLKGLMDGLEIDKSTKEGRIIAQMSELMEDIVLYVDDLQAQVDELTELCEILDEDLGEIEEEIYGDEDFNCGNCDCFDDDDEDEDYDFDSDDDELYEVTCPTCGDTILIDEGMIEEGSINCPNCDEILEFDYENLTIEDFEKAETDDISDDE